MKRAALLAIVLLVGCAGPRAPARPEYDEPRHLWTGKRFANDPTIFWAASCTVSLLRPETDGCDEWVNEGAPDTQEWRRE